MKIEKRITPENIQKLNEDEIFVFGSNLAGRHGAGAAKLALKKFGAIYGEGIGLHGQSYALPTVNETVTNKLDLDYIQEFIDELFWIVIKNPIKKFYITQVGCGLAGWSVKDIAPLFVDFITVQNAYMPDCFWNILIKE